MIATFDEDEDVLRPTVVGALGIRNDVEPEVWVLDDGGRAWVGEMCDELGARYLSRPAPRAAAKAGNINHALGYVDAEFLVTLDADHVPRPELLERMLGYMADPKVAVVQGPQAFYNRGFGHPRAHDDPLRNEQSIFFDVICPGKDRHGAAFWCGCPSVLRRAALDDVGGVATSTVVEDAHTSMLLNARGWRVVYHDEVMALGLAPEEIGAFVVQRGRWARGSIQMLRLERPMFRRGLTWAQRLEYSASCLHFLEGVQRLVGFLVPPIVLATGAVPISASPYLYLAVFAPQFVLVPLTSWALTRGRYRPIEGERYAVVRMEGYLRALGALPRGSGKRLRRHAQGRPLRRLPGAARPAPADRAGRLHARRGRLPGRRPAPRPAAPPHARRVHGHHPLGLRSTSPSSSTSPSGPRASSTVAAATASRCPSRPPTRPTRRPCPRWRATSTTSAATAPASSSPTSGTPASACAWSSCSTTAPIEVTGEVATVKRVRGTETWRVGVGFDPMEPAVADTIVSWCFRNPFGSTEAVVAVAPERRRPERRSPTRRRCWPPPRRPPPPRASIPPGPTRVPRPPERRLGYPGPLGTWRSLVAHRLWVAGVPGSNPGVPTEVPGRRLLTGTGPAWLAGLPVRRSS